MRQKKWYNGRSNPTGFELHWLRRKKGNVIIISDQTKNYKTTEENDFLGKKARIIKSLAFWILLVTIGALSIFSSSVVFNHFVSFRIAGVCLLTIGWILFSIVRNLSCEVAEVYVRYLRDFYSHRRRQWHAAEHKAVNLLEKEIPATMENLRKMPIFRSECGSRSFSSYLSLCLSWIGFLLLFSLGSLISFFGAVIAAVVFFFWFNIFFSYWLFYILQMKLFTVEPTEEQLKEALELVLRLKSSIDESKSVLK